MFVALLAALHATWHVVAPQAPAARGAELIRGGPARCTAVRPASAFALAARTLPLLNVPSAIVPANDAHVSICAQLGKHYIDVITAQFYIKYGVFAWLITNVKITARSM